MSVAEITIIGHLGKNPEMRYLPSGKAVTNFSVATTREWKNKDGNKEKEVTWFKISAFDKQAESCQKFLFKGSQVYIKGRLVVDNATGGPKIWSRQDGSKGASFEVNAQDVRFLSKKSDVDSVENESDTGSDGFPY
jgi:single-strand DNA-binding protein